MRSSSGMSLSSLSAAACLALLVVAGCGENVTPGNFQSREGNAECDALVRCHEIGSSDHAACLAALKTALANNNKIYSLDDSIAAKRVSFDGAMAQSCLDGLAATSCTGNAPPAACNHVFTPLVAVGGICKTSDECIGGFCQASVAGCAGTCIALAATGADCSNINVKCKGSDFCAAGSRLCTALGAAGSACASSFDCQDGLACDGGHCIVRGSLKLGDVCMAGSVGGCGANLYCDNSKQPAVCAAQIAAGASCSAQLSCPNDLTCVGLSVNMSTGVIQPGKCSPYLDVGAACDPAAAVSGCPFLSMCDKTAKTCPTAFGSIGSTCASDLDCHDGLFAPSSCDPSTKKCIGYKTLGDKCDPAQDHCLNSACDPTTKVCALICT